MSEEATNWKSSTLPGITPEPAPLATSEPASSEPALALPMHSVRPLLLVAILLAVGALGVTLPFVRGLRSSPAAASVTTAPEPRARPTPQAQTLVVPLGPAPSAVADDAQRPRARATRARPSNPPPTTRRPRAEADPLSFRR